MNSGTIVNRCDHRRLVTPEENLENCRDANEEGVSPYNGGCDANNSPALNQPIPENDAMCWEVQKFGEPCDDNCGSGGGGGGDNDVDDPPEEEEEEVPPEEEEEIPPEEEEETPPEEEEEITPEEEVPPEEEEEEEIPPEEEEFPEDWEEEEEEREEWCEDDEEFLFRGKDGKTCEWISKRENRINRLCEKKAVRLSCPETCDECP